MNKTLKRTEEVLTTLLESSGYMRAVRENDTGSWAVHFDAAYRHLLAVRTELQEQDHSVISTETCILRNDRCDSEKKMPHIEDIIHFESGQMGDDATIAFFQGMIDSGVVWQLQGFYGRMASNLIDEGLCHQVTEEQGE